MEEEPAGDEPGAAAALTPRQRAARRRHRRRVIGVLVFAVVAVGVFGAAYVTFAPSDDSELSASRSGPLTTTTTVVKPSGPYRVITGVNVREGPGTDTPSVGTVETGHVVFITCVIDGESVDGPAGPSTKWVRLGGFGPNGYVTVQYVDLGSDLQVPGRLPVCPAA